MKSKKLMITTMILILSISLLGIAYAVKLKTNLKKPENNPMASAIKPVGNTAEKSGQTDGGINESNIVSDYSKQQALDLYNQGLTVYYDREFAKALALFNQALESDPNCYQALNGKGAAKAFSGEYAEGIRLIQKAIALNPTFEYAHFNLGLAYELAGNWTEAISAYQEALKLDAGDAWAYYGIASIYGRKGDVNNTVEYLKQAISIEPDAKETAKTEHDFDNIRNSSAFQELLK